jgi:hypothetical protein
MSGVGEIAEAARFFERLHGVRLSERMFFFAESLGLPLQQSVLGQI